MSRHALPVIFCFAGQGSQYYQMARDLLAGNETFNHWMRLGDALVAERHGFSLIAEIYGEGRKTGAQFDNLAASHPAIFLVQFALAKALLHLRLVPDLLLGASLGEFTAHAVAGMTSFEAALLSVSDQPAVFQRHCPAGGMISVLESPRLAEKSPLLHRCSEFAGISSKRHFVLSALADDLPAVQAELMALAAPFQRLPVPFAFHSRFIDKAERDFRQLLESASWESPFWPIWSACLGRAETPASMPQHLWDIVRRPMNTAGAFEAIEQEGGAVYVDLSPSGTIAAILKQAISSNSPSRIFPLLSPFGGNVERINKAVDTIRN